MIIRQMVTCAAAVVALAGVAQAQVAPAIQNGTRPVIGGPKVQVIQQMPEVVRITASWTVGSTGCGMKPVLYERGQTPPMQLRAATMRGQALAMAPAKAQRASATAYAELLGAPDGKLSQIRLIGPLMQFLSRAELVIGNGPARDVALRVPMAPSEQCERVFSSITAYLQLPDVTSPTLARLRLYGSPRNISRTADGEKLCFANTGELDLKAAIPCNAQPGPAQLVEEVVLAIYPHPRFEATLPPNHGFTSRDVQVGGLVRLSGRNLGNIVFPVPDSTGTVTGRTISQSPTEWTGEYFYNFRNGPAAISQLLTPGVLLMRDNALVPVDRWDTALNLGDVHTSTARLNLTRR